MNFNSKDATTVEIIKLMMAKKNVTITELATLLNESRQNIHKKFKKIISVSKISTTYPMHLDMKL